MIRALIEWIVIGIGAGTAVSLFRYFAVYYIVRQIRRYMKLRRHNKEVQT